MKSFFKFGRLKAHGNREEIQIENLNGEVHSGLKHPQEFGFESKAPKGSTTYSVYQEGNPDNGATLIIAGRAPITLSEGESVQYSAGGAYVKCTGSKIEINGTDFGGLIKIDELTTKLNDFISTYNSHTHIGSGVINSGTAVPFVAADYENTDVEHG